MTQTTPLNWPLIIGLGAFALVRPLVRILESQLGIESQPAVPIAITIVVSIVWIAVVGLGTYPQPVITLVLAALVYGLLAIVLSAILSPMLDGALAGPLANPIAIVPVLVTNVVWGLVTGGLALVLQRARGAQTRRD